LKQAPEESDRRVASKTGANHRTDTDPPWGKEGQRQMPQFAAWAASKLKPEGGVLLIYTGHSGLLEVGNQIAKRLTYPWTLSCVNGHSGGTSTRHDLMIPCCWRPILMFCRGEYRPQRTFDDAVISDDRDKTHHDYQQPLSEALFYIKALTGPKSVICDPFLGAATSAVAVARLGQGRKFWGAEVDPETCAIARNRVAEELESPGATAARSNRCGTNTMAASARG
jgi:hypothetical protein